MLDECLDIARRHGYDHAVIEILRLLGGTAQKQGLYAEAGRRYAESLALARMIKDESSIRWGVIHQGWLELLQGNPAAAQAALLDMLPLFERYEPPWAVAWLEARLARIALELGDPAGAARHYVHCLLLCQRNDFRWGVAECLEGMAALAAPSQFGATRAASLLGAAGALRADLGQTRAVHEEDLYARTMERLRAQFDPAALASAEEHGAALSLDAAIGLAVTE
jgi:tetratricopeptide (TPR) repeat protein